MYRICRNWFKNFKEKKQTTFEKYDIHKMERQK